MKKEKKSAESCKEWGINNWNNSCKICNNGAIYGLSVVGALFYFMQGATTFGLVVMGIVKAFFWPAILMFELLSYLQL